MSGDVQPRKRKDKKRRKDEGEQIPIQTHAPSPTNSSSDDVNIHVHKEGGTGGGICAKLVFFVLLSALVVVLGMIITQYRGLTDVETVDTESRFSHLFEGWIDSSPDHHDDHIEDTLDDHDEDDEHDASENDEDEEDEEHEPSEEADDEDDENVDDTEVSDERNEDDEDDDDDQDEDEEQAVEESEENQVDEDEDDDDVQASEERETYESEEKDEDDEDNDDDDDEQDHDEDEQELENIESEEGKDEDDEADDDVSTEKKSRRDHEDEDEADADEGEEDEDDTNAGKAHVITKRAVVKSAKDGSAPQEEKQQESAGMVVKLGVGVALLVVAHLVLVRKWRTAPDDKPKPVKQESEAPSPNLSRRNTIVMPPTFQEVEPDIEPEEEYSEEEELSEEEVHETKSAKTRYQELRSTYTRSLTPEGEIGYHKPPETYDDEDEENVDDEEEEEISEEEEDDEEKQESEEEEDEEEYDEDEDEELLKRLEAKYGKLRGEGATERQADIENSDSEKSDDGTEYQYSNITNKDDYKIKSDIDEAHKSVQNNSAFAIKLFDKILQKHPSSPRSIYGKALALDYLADQKRSNDILQQALNFYIQLLNMQNVPNALFKTAADRCINRMRFVGQYRNAINVHKLLIQRFPNDPKYSNDLAVTYLTINRIKEARSVLLQILDKWPNDGFALVHYGFILKTADNKLDEAVDYLERGLETRGEGVIDGRFYFHLGDALARLGQNDKAMKVYEQGVKDKVFLSKYQRSLYNVPRLTGRPWWDPPDLPYLDLFRLLRQNWKKIRDEGMAVLNEKGYFQDESENLKDTGDWKQFELFARGQRNSNCRVCPVTCSIIERIPEAKSCKRGQTKFSVIHPGTHVWPHCGPTNCRLRVHLGLKVPPKTFIRVADETRSWEEGEILVFDDSFEHEVWHNGTEFRLVLIVDVWHPELTAAEKRSLSPI